MSSEEGLDVSINHLTLKQGPPEISKRTLSFGIHWDKIRKWVKAGMATPGLSEKIVALDKKKIDLNLLTPIPWSSAKPDLSAYRFYRDQLLRQRQVYADEILSRLDKISFKDLLRYLKKTARTVDDFVVENSDKKLVFLTEYGKSQHWILAIIFRFLNIMPASIIDINDRRNLCTLTEDTILILFDDGSYSGKQLISNMSKIAQRVPANCNIHVLFAFSYMTRTAIDKTTTAIQHYEERNPNLKIQLLYQREIKSCRDLNWGEYNDTFNETIAWLTTDEYCRDHSEKTLVYTDWKTPDYMSMVGPFFRSNCIRPSGWFHEHQRERIAWKDCPPWLQNCQPIIPDVPKPY